MKCFAIFLILFACMCSDVLSAGHQHESNISANELNNLFVKDSDVDHSGVFSATVLSGCDDFHCRECKNRNHCTGRPNCDMADCGHEHGLVLLEGGSLFFLRSANGIADERGKLSCFSRAKLVSSRLNKFISMMDNHGGCQFLVLDKNHNPLSNDEEDPVIWFYMPESGKYHKVLAVTKYDLAGYVYRSDNTGLANMAMPSENLNKKIVAQWWASLLSDYFSMFANGQPPRLTTDTHCGKALYFLWEAMADDIAKGEKSVAAFKNALNALSDEKRTRLFIAAQIVPKTFAPSSKTGI